MFAGELEALLQRASRGRDELELRRLDEAEKRGNRFRCVVQVSLGDKVAASAVRCSSSWVSWSQQTISC